MEGISFGTNANYEIYIDDAESGEFLPSFSVLGQLTPIAFPSDDRGKIGNECDKNKTTVKIALSKKKKKEKKLSKTTSKTKVPSAKSMKAVSQSENSSRRSRSTPRQSNRLLKESPKVSRTVLRSREPMTSATNNKPVLKKKSAEKGRGRKTVEKKNIEARDKKLLLQKKLKDVRPETDTEKVKKVNAKQSVKKAKRKIKSAIKESGKTVVETDENDLGREVELKDVPPETDTEKEKRVNAKQSDKKAIRRKSERNKSGKTVVETDENGLGRDVEVKDVQTETDTEKEKRVNAKKSVKKAKRKIKSARKKSVKTVVETDENGMSREVEVEDGDQEGQVSSGGRQKWHRCRTCAQKFSHRIHLLNHRATHVTKPFSCSECDRKYMSKYSLKEHVDTHHLGKPYIRHTLKACPTCGKVVLNLSRHMVVHSTEKPFICEICANAFANERYLKFHILSHLEKRPHVCDSCTKTFVRKSDLQRHLLVHTGEKPHICSVCGKGFNRTFHLREHMKLHSDEKTFKCSHCSAGFNQQGTLKRHELTHLDRKPFVCRECYMDFATAGDLKRHSLKHTNERNFVCMTCGKAFGRACSLRRHNLTHSGLKNHQCDICSRSFAQRGNLYAHMRLHEKKKLKVKKEK